MKDEKPQTKERLQVQLHPETKIALKVMAAQQGISVSEVLERLVQHRVQQTKAAEHSD